MVLINVMRGGPGLGSIGPSQADYFQATKGHGHGDYRVPVLAPSSIAEAVALTADAFELAERYRTPVIILADGVMGQAMEPVVPVYRTPAARAGGLGADGRRRARAAGRPLAAPPPGGARGPQPPPAGQVRRDRRARGPLGGRGPRRRRDRHRRLRHVGAGRAHGGRAGPRAGRPGRHLPAHQPLAVPVRGARGRSPRALRAVVVVEMSAGQMVEDVRLAVEGRVPVFFQGRTGGMVPTPGEVVDAVVHAAPDRTAPAGRPRRWREGGDPMTTLTTDTRRVIYQRPEALIDTSTHYCPGCGHGIIHRLVAELLDEMHLAPTHHRRRLRRLQRLRLRLPRRRLRRVAPRPRPGRGHRRPPRAPRRVRLHLPGRRRPGRHRHGRDRPRRGPRRADQRHLRQQRHLRHDRRPDGADDAARADARPRARPGARPAWPATRSPSPRCSPLLPGVSYAARGSIADPHLIGRTKAMLRAGLRGPARRRAACRSWRSSRPAPSAGA